MYIHLLMGALYETLRELKTETLSKPFAIFNSARQLSKSIFAFTKPLSHVGSGHVVSRVNVQY